MSCKSIIFCKPQSILKVCLINPPISAPLLAVIRLHAGLFTSQSVLSKLLLPVASLLNLIVIQFCYHCIFPREVKIGDRFCIPHPFGIVLSPYVRIGHNVKIMQFVTIGINEHLEDENRELIIDDGVYIGAGAKIIGNRIRIGEGAVIGAGAVVVRDVTPWTIVAGVPARPIRTMRPAATSFQGGAAATKDADPKLVT